MVERASVVRRVVCVAVWLGGLLGSQAAWADQAPGAAEPAFCPPEECGQQQECVRDAECGPGLVCLGVYSCGLLHPSTQHQDPERVACDQEDVPGLCGVAPPCEGDHQCGTEQVCDRPAAPQGEEHCLCDAEGDCVCSVEEVPRPLGECRNYDELFGQDPCAAVSCEQGYECAVVSPTCAPGEPCPTVEPWAECVAPDGGEDDGDEDGGDEDGGSLFERDGFVNGAGGSEGDAQEGCAVGGVGAGRAGSSWGLGALVVGALALLRRRR